MGSDCQRFVRSRFDRKCRSGQLFGSQGGHDWFDESLAREFAARSVTVNAIAPGFIDADMTSSLDEESRKSLLGLFHCKRFGSVSDIAEMASYLCSDKASSGQVLRLTEAW